MNHGGVLVPVGPVRGVVARAATAHAGRMPLSTLTPYLSASGNEVTDATRAAAALLGTTASGQMLDAFAVPTKVTNLLTNGGFETNTTGWGVYGLAPVFSRITTDAKFGAACCQILRDASTGFIGIESASIATVGSYAYTASAWIKPVTGNSLALGEIALRITEQNGAAPTSVIVTGAGLTFDVWGRLTATKTLAADCTSVRVEVYLTTTGAGRTILVDGVQLEMGSVANPYVETNGAIATSVTPASGDGSFGIRRAATNLFRRGQCDSVADSWSGLLTGSTVAIDASVPAPFSTQSIRVTTPGTVVNEGVQCATASGLAAAAATLGAGAVYFLGIAGASYTAAIQWRGTDASFTRGTNLVLNGTGAWQLITPASFGVPAAKTGDILYIQVFTTTARAETFWVAHAMLEGGHGVVSPYVATAGGATATHAAASMTAAVGLLGAQAWCVARVRFGGDPTQEGYAAGDGPTIASFGDSAAEEYILYYRAGDASVRMRSLHSGASTGDSVIATGVAAGTLGTVIGSWTPTGVALSVNGGAFVKVNTTGAPTLVAPTFYIGTNRGVSHFNGDLLWFACGSGTLTDADAASINTRIATSELMPHELPGNPTMVWDGRTTYTMLPGQPLRGTVTRAATIHAGRVPGVAVSRGTLARAATAHVGVRQTPTMIAGTRNKLLVLGEWGDDEQHRVMIGYAYNLGGWVVARTAVREDAVLFPAPAPVSGDSPLVIGAWQAGALAISVGGSPFVSVPSTIIPAISSLFVFVGGNTTGGNAPGVHYEWAVFGSGVPTDADAAALAALGTTDPEFHSSVALTWDGTSYFLEAADPLPLLPFEMTADTKLVSRFNLPVAGLLAKATVYLDGLGSGGVGAQACRAVLYDAANNLIATSDEVLVPVGQAAGWVDFSFGSKVVLPAGDFYLGLHAGAYSKTIRMFGSGPHGMGGKWNADTYSDGASAVFGAATGVLADYASYITTYESYVPPSEVVETDMYLARLPLPEAQRALAVGGPEGTPSSLVEAGWHDTFTDPETGSFALVRDGSPLASLLGERIRITALDSPVPRSVVAYVHNLADADAFDWDLSLTRHLFAQIAPLASDTTPVVIEVLG